MCCCAAIVKQIAMKQYWSFRMDNLLKELHRRFQTIRQHAKSRFQHSSFTTLQVSRRYFACFVLSSWSDRTENTFVMLISAKTMLFLADFEKLIAPQSELLLCEWHFISLRKKTTRLFTDEREKVNIRIMQQSKYSQTSFSCAYKQIQHCRGS